jgi:hypothetical protein
LADSKISLNLFGFVAVGLIVVSSPHCSRNLDVHFVFFAGVVCD